MSGPGLRTRLAAIVLGCLACRADPGIADYTSHVGLTSTEGDADFLPGPFPYIPGTPRLGFTPWYEGPRTENYPFNGTDTFLFVFDTVGDGTGTFTAELESTSDRVEGFESYATIHAGLTFWGFGVFWYEARDVSQYSALFLSLKSFDEAFEEVTITFESGPDRPANPADDDVFSVMLDATDYGYVADGEWHSLVIPLEDLAQRGLDLTSIRTPFIFGGGAGGGGEVLLIDDIFME